MGPIKIRFGPLTTLAAVVVGGFVAAHGALAQNAAAQAAADDTVFARGLYNWVHTTGDAEEAFAFYHDVFGIQLGPFPFGGEASAAPESIRPVEQARSDELVWNLTATEGSRFRTVFMRASGTPFGLELSEFFDIPRRDRPANPWDPGASILIFEVRDLEAVLRRLNARQALVVTTGGQPVATPTGKSILVRDPDGYLVQVTQASAPPEGDGDVVGTSIAISVAETDRALHFYRDLLGFQSGATRRAAADEAALFGLNGGALESTPITIAGTGIGVSLLAFSPPPEVAVVPIQWRIQDVGAPQFQLEVIDLDRLLERTHTAGFEFLSIDAQPIDRPFGRFVFAIDPDGVLVEFVEPASRR